MREIIELYRSELLAEQPEEEWKAYLWSHLDSWLQYAKDYQLSVPPVAGLTIKGMEPREAVRREVQARLQRAGALELQLGDRLSVERGIGADTEYDLARTEGERRRTAEVRFVEVIRPRCVAFHGNLDVNMLRNETVGTKDRLRKFRRSSGNLVGNNSDRGEQ